MRLSRASALTVACVLTFSRLVIGATDPIAEPVSLDKVLGYLQANPDVRSIDSLLSALPETFRSNYTLVHKSNSLQIASPELPRAIVFGTDASFVVAFNGDPKADRYDTLEMIQFHADQAAFEFREIRFPESADSPGAPTVSEKNPALCVTCHQSDLRPNWEHYSTWPGAFASDDDRFDESDPDVHPRLLAFLDQADSLPRYRQLIAVKDGYSNAGFRSKVEHNITFTQRIAVHNFQRVARLMRATPDFDKFQYAAMGSVWCNSAIRDFFPPKLRQKYASALDQVSQGAYSEGQSVRYLFDARGIATRPWFLDFVAVPAEMSFGTPGYPQEEFTGPIVDANPDLSPFFTVTGGDYHDAPSRLGTLTEQGCTGLQQKSLQALAPLEAAL
jgi:hypothetical protein